MNESTVAYLRRRLMDAQYDPEIESKLNKILEVLDDLLFNLSESDDE